MLTAPASRRAWIWLIPFALCGLGWQAGGWDIHRLWPAITALVAVFALRSALAGLCTGVAAGLPLLYGLNPLNATAGLWQGGITPALSSSWNLSVLAFTCLMGSLVAVLENGGGFSSLAQRMTRSARTPRDASARVRLATVSLGMVCFFDGLANALLVGRVLRPLAARHGVSRSMLAYLVDSTSSPIACVAVVSTWIVYQLSLIREGLAAQGIEGNPYLIFLSSLPHHAYSWLTLILVVAVAWRAWSIGPMRAAESAAQSAAYSRADDKVNPEPSATASRPWWAAMAPIVWVLVFVMGGLWVSGAGWSFPDSLESLGHAFGAANAALVLLGAAGTGLIVAIGFNPSGALAAAFNGLRSMLVPVAILIAAWLIGGQLRDLGAATWLAELLKQNLSPALFPVLVFLIASITAFCTGTSWGTMGVLLPLAIPVALGFSDPSTPTEWLPITLGAVMGGAVFGDHCSPLSDTTIVAAIASGVEPWEHVRTQLPYALLTASAAAAFCFLPGGFGFPWWLSLPISAVLLLGGVRYIAQRRRD